MKAEIKGNKLHLELNIEPATSKSGKSTVVASTRGNVQTSCQYKNKNITIGVNAYVPIG